MISVFFFKLDKSLKSANEVSKHKELLKSYSPSYDFFGTREKVLRVLGFYYHGSTFLSRAKMR